MLIYLDTSLDNMLLSFGLGALAPHSMSRTTVCFTFMAAEATAALSGGLLRSTSLGHWSQLLNPAIVPLYILFAAAVALRLVATRSIRPQGLLLVAFLFSLDNFIAAAGGQTKLNLFTSALLPAAVSGLSAIPALEAGRLLSRQLRRIRALRPMNAQLLHQRS